MSSQAQLKPQQTFNQKKVRLGLGEISKFGYEIFCRKNSCIFPTIVHIKSVDVFFITSRKVQTPKQWKIVLIHSFLHKMWCCRVSVCLCLMNDKKSFLSPNLHKWLKVPRKFDYESWEQCHKLGFSIGNLI